MGLLTLARYVLETSLMHYEFVQCSESRIAAAAMLLALRMRKWSEWVGVSGKHVAELSG